MIEAIVLIRNPEPEPNDKCHISVIFHVKIQIFMNIN